MSTQHACPPFKWKEDNHMGHNDHGCNIHQQYHKYYSFKIDNVITVWVHRLIGWWIIIGDDNNFSSSSIIIWSITIFITITQITMQSHTAVWHDCLRPAAVLNDKEYLQEPKILLASFWPAMKWFKLSIIFFTEMSDKTQAWIRYA